MGYEFRPAVREQTSLLIGLAGPSGSGKTFSALALAEGLADGGKIAFIDTEAGRALHYADRFKFDHCEIRPPFRPQAYSEAIAAADKAGYAVIVIDSMSHEYDGDGGIIEWAADLERNGTKSPGNWKEPKTAHKRMMSRLLQCRAHLIFCLRAEEKIRIEKDDRGKTVVVPAGWQPLCEKRFMFEMTASFMLLPDRPGFPQAIKLQDQHRAAFPPDRQVNAESGKALSAWAHGGAERRPMSAGSSLYDDGRAEADRGTDALKAWFEGLSRADKLAIKPRMGELKTAAAEADAAPEPAFDDTPSSAPSAAPAATPAAEDDQAEQAGAVVDSDDPNDPSSWPSWLARRQNELDSATDMDAVNEAKQAAEDVMFNEADPAPPEIVDGFKDAYLTAAKRVTAGGKRR